jgi:predicted AAA+ superfamily ATPase
MRYFNTYGPVNVQEHFVVPRDALVTDRVAQIEQDSYFTVYAPRQMGKTTLILESAQAKMRSLGNKPREA